MSHFVPYSDDPVTIVPGIPGVSIMPTVTAGSIGFYGSPASDVYISNPLFVGGGGGSSFDSSSGGGAGSNGRLVMGVPSGGVFLTNTPIKQESKVSAALKSMVAGIKEVMERPPQKPMAKPLVRKHSDEELAEYLAVAQKVGVTTVPGTNVEAMKNVLSKLDIPVYDLQTVIRYMDYKSKKEGSGYGWKWTALRKQDVSRTAGYQAFGVAATVEYRGRQVITPASDRYGDTREVYQHIVPLHALRRVAAIEEAIAGKALAPAFMVSDYEKAVNVIRPDPFLMVVVNNNGLGAGHGRFVIDFWDEPGFGIEEMLNLKGK